MAIEERFEKLFAYIRAQQDRAVNDLITLCRQPSISAQNIGLVEMASLLQKELAASGFDVKIYETPGYPIVYAEQKGASDRTLLFYNHYDVQPVDPLEEWISPPFEPTVREGKVFARGATDNKGNIVSRLAAIKALRDLHGQLPLTVKWIIEGEEEILSPNLGPFVERHREMLMADGCVWEDTMGRVDAPIVSLGNKGFCAIELTCRVADIDSHSAYANIYPNAAWRLVHALATFKDENENVTIDGFYDRVRPYTPAEQRILDQLPPVDGNSLKAIRGLRRLVRDLTDNEIHRAQTSLPTCNIAGIVSGYTGPGNKSVIPAQARAKVDMRLVPDQDPDEIVELVRAHLKRRGYDDIEVKLLAKSYPSRSAAETPLNEVIRQASLQAYGKEPIFEPAQAGATPMWVIEKYLGIPCAATGVGYVTSMTHAPNENIEIRHLVEGACYMAAIMVYMAEI